MSSNTVTMRMNYNEYAANITGSPKAVHKIGTQAIANQFLQRQTQAQQNSSGAMPHYGGGAEKCARCSKSVYLAEKKVGAGRSFHSRCFSCHTCNRKLDATNLSEHKGEIYCKTCYTRQFGVHGLISGVTMSTEQVTREVRHSRRSSYGSDLDAPVITHQTSRPRAHSNDNILRGETSAVQNDEVPKMFPWRNDVIPERRSPSPTSSPVASTKKSDLELLIEKNRQEKTTNPLGFGRVIETNVRDEHQQLNRKESTYTGEQDRQKYIIEGEKISYAHSTAAFANVPVVSPPKPPTESHVGRIEIPTLPPTSPSPPSPKPFEPVRRQNSSGTPIDITDNFSRLTLNDKVKRQDSNGHITSTIASENPLAKQTYSHSSSYETSHFTTTTGTAHSRDSSPSSNSTHNQRTASSTSGYASSHVISEGNPRHSTSPSPLAFVAQHDYLNTDRSPTRNSQTIEHRPSSPRTNERTSSALHEFASKTNHLSGNFSPSNPGKYSTLGALVQPLRPASRDFSDDDDFN